ncbi:hypothetical protein RB195_017161 [Necator americanus]|uniref:PIN domain-containing protein n=1 Tax=Necator americanus TaxID=51031 RepID=A0ABR1C7L1_NECAM
MVFFTGFVKQMNVQDYSNWTWFPYGGMARARALNLQIRTNQSSSAWQQYHTKMRGETFYCIDEYCTSMDLVTVKDDCQSETALSQPTTEDYEEIRELRSSKLDGKDLPQELCMYKRPIHSSEINGCVIVDTCAVVGDPELIETSATNKIFVMVPFPVLKELDKLHKHSRSPGLRKRAQFAMQCLRKWVSNPYVFMESSSESQEKVSGFVAAPNDNDDLILKCAYRIQTGLPETCPLVNRIYFVTNDSNLSLKATAHGVLNFTTQDYFTSLRRLGLLRTTCAEEEPMEVDPIPQSVSSKHLNVKSSGKSDTKRNQLYSEDLMSRPINLQIHKRSSRKKRKPKKHDDYLQSRGVEKKTRCEPSYAKNHDATAGSTNEGGEIRGNYVAESVSNITERKDSRRTYRDSSYLSVQSGFHRPTAPQRRYSTERSLSTTPRCFKSLSEPVANTQQFRTERFHMDREIPRSKYQDGQCRGYPKRYEHYESRSIRTPTERMGRLSIVNQPYQGVAVVRAQNSRKQTSAARDVSNSFISTPEYVLKKFLSIWNGLTEKFVDKIERGLSSEKVRADIRGLWKCAARLCEKTDLDSFKELVELSTSLYYFITSDPAYQDLKFAPPALSSGLQMMMNKSSAAAVELVESITRFLNDPRVFCVASFLSLLRFFSFNISSAVTMLFSQRLHLLSSLPTPTYSACLAL